MMNVYVVTIYLLIVLQCIHTVLHTYSSQTGSRGNISSCGVVGYWSFVYVYAQFQ